MPRPRPEASAPSNTAKPVPDAFPRQVGKLQPEARVGAIDPEPPQRFFVGHARERRRHIDADGPEHALDERLDDRVDRLGLGERHLEIDLREFRLAVRAQILVAEAPRELVVPLEAPPPSGAA
jgi:hypothetical protein